MGYDETDLKNKMLNYGNKSNTKVQLVLRMKYPSPKSKTFNTQDHMDKYTTYHP